MATTRLLAAQHKRPEHVLIGEEGFFLGRPRKGNVTATTDCRLLEIPASLFMDIAQASPHFAEMLLCGVLVALGRKLADTSEMRARYEATIGGNWTIWGADDDTFIRRYGGL